jgi:proprotein convertase subtilisin/kexin type 5
MLRGLLTILLFLALVSLVTCPCPSSQYEANGVCYNCDVTCKTCTSSTTTSCLTCDATRFLTSFNSCQCSDGSVEKNPIVSQCQTLSCHYSCATCNVTATTCTSCDAVKKRVYVSGSNTCPCIVQYYDSGSSTCSACHYTCTTCSGSTISNCLTCDGPTAHRGLSSTSCPCLNKYYDVTNTYICASCNYKCATC